MILALTFAAMRVVWGQGIIYTEPQPQPYYSLGYEFAVFNADSAPLVTPPTKIGTNYVARYLFRWLDPRWPEPKEAGSIIPALLEVKVNASNRAIERMVISGRATRRPAPKVEAVPPMLNPKAPQKMSDGNDTAAVSDAYAKAFLEAILPQLSEFIIQAGLKLPTPVTTNQIVMTNYLCRILNGQPIAQLYFTNGDRFNYQHGCFDAFYAHDAFMSFPDIGRPEDFLGRINMTEDDAISLCEGVLRKLGYAKKLPEPSVSYAAVRSPLAFTRYNYYWRHTGDEIEFAHMEVDMETKTIKAIFLKDAAFQHESPKIVLPIQPTLPVKPAPTSKSQLTGGQPTQPVSDAYATAFLNAILPQLSNFIAQAGLEISLSGTTNQIMVTNYFCRLLQGQPIAQLYLKNGDRFNYQAGYFDAFYAHDAMDKYPETGWPEDFLGHINMSTNEAISLCENVMRKLGYQDKLPVPIISYAVKRWALDCTRYTYYWRHPGEDFEFAHMEVDMETKTIKSIFLKDAAFAKPPPKLETKP